MHNNPNYLQKYAEVRPLDPFCLKVLDFLLTNIVFSGLYLNVTSGSVYCLSEPRTSISLRVKVLPEFSFIMFLNGPTLIMLFTF